MINIIKLDYLTKGLDGARLRRISKFLYLFSPLLILTVECITNIKSNEPLQ